MSGQIVKLANRDLSNGRKLVLTYRQTPKVGKQRFNRHTWEASLMGEKGEVLAEIELVDMHRITPYEILAGGEGWLAGQDLTTDTQIEGGSDYQRIYGAIVAVISGVLDQQGGEKSKEA